MNVEVYYNSNRHSAERDRSLAQPNKSMVFNATNEKDIIQKIMSEFYHLDAEEICWELGVDTFEEASLDNLYEYLNNIDPSGGYVIVLSITVDGNKVYEAKDIDDWREYDDESLREGLLSKAETLKNNLSASDQLDAWFEEYVPAEGKAETLGGEIVRAICKIGHRWNNDGDRFGVGYGNETCNDAVCFLLKYVPGLVDTTYDLTTYSVKEIQEDVFADYCIDTNEYIGSSDEGYEQWLNQTYETVANYLKAHSDLFKTPAEESYDDFYDKEWSTTYCPHFCPSCGEYIFNREDMNADSDIWDSWWSDSGHEESEFNEDYQQRASDIIRQYTDDYNSSCCSGCLSDAESELDSLWEEFEDEQDDNDYDDDDDEELQESTLKESRIKSNGELLDFSESDLKDYLTESGYKIETSDDFLWVLDADGVIIVSIALTREKYFIESAKRYCIQDATLSGSSDLAWAGQDFEEFKRDFKDAIANIYPESKRIGDI